MVHQNKVWWAARRPVFGIRGGQLSSILVSLLVALALNAADAEARRRKPAPRAPKSLPSREIKPDMKGYGLTVMRGTKVERFKVKFIGVLHNKLPQQDMIMIRCSGLGLEHSGIIAGMSGPGGRRHPDRRHAAGARSQAQPRAADPTDRPNTLPACHAGQRSRRGPR